MSGRVSQSEDMVDRIVKLIMEVERRERELVYSMSGKVTSGDKEELQRLKRTLASTSGSRGSIWDLSLRRVDAGRISDRIELFTWS
jgi:hypothetical protein